MKDSTKYLIKMFYIEELGYDFMGYTRENNGDYSFHHLIIPKRAHGTFSKENGAIIFRKPHDYLHIIEMYDLDIFEAITSEMIDMNIKGYLDMYNIIRINDILENFEREYSGKRNHKNQLIVKEQYTRRLIKK